jgi:hypothetical protein
MIARLDEALIVPRWRLVVGLAALIFLMLSHV